ncbi:hypothetical protein Trydic_g19642, partial [Trypoxylus dichotomus]
LYPKRVLQEDWKNLAVFGVIMAFIVMVFVVDETETMLDIVKFVEDPPPDIVETLNAESKLNFVRRMKSIIKHFIVNGFI